MTPIAPHMEAFLRERLPVERGASINTCDSYAYAFKLLLEYASDRLKVTPSATEAGATRCAADSELPEVPRDHTPQWPELEKHPSGGHQIVHALHGVPGTFGS